MDHIQILPACKEISQGISSTASFTDKITSLIHYGKIDSNNTEFESMPCLPEQESVSKAKEALASNITEVPTFFTPIITLPEVTEETRATLSNLSAEACKRAIISNSAQGILDKADYYGISYQYGIQYTETWDQFVDAVYQWEDLLEESDNLGIEWSDDNYDSQGLAQSIEVAENEQWREQQAMRSEYFAAKALGV